MRGAATPRSSRWPTCPGSAAARRPARAAHRDEPRARRGASRRPSTPAARRSCWASAAARAPTAAPGWWRRSARRLLDADGTRLPPGGAALADLASTRPGARSHRIGGVRVTVACDVDNPLCGPARRGGGLRPAEGRDAGPGGGARRRAGRTGPTWSRRQPAATTGDRRAPVPPAVSGSRAVAVLGAELRSRHRSGARPRRVRRRTGSHGADLVVTGEGSLDEQTLHGKAPAGVAAAAAARGIPVVAVCGRTTLDAERLRAAGIHADVRADRDRAGPAAVLRRGAPHCWNSSASGSRASGSPRPTAQRRERHS